MIQFARSMILLMFVKIPIRLTSFHPFQFNEFYASKYLGLHWFQIAKFASVREHWILLQSSNYQNASNYIRVLSMNFVSVSKTRLRYLGNCNKVYQILLFSNLRLCKSVISCFFIIFRHWKSSFIFYHSKGCLASKRLEWFLSNI